MQKLSHIANSVLAKISQLQIMLTTESFSRTFIRRHSSDDSASLCSSSAKTHAASVATESVTSQILFTHRHWSQWPNGNMPDYGAPDPTLESHRGQFVCLSWNHCNIQLWAQAAHTITALDRKWVPPSGLSIGQHWPTLMLPLNDCL